MRNLLRRWFGGAQDSAEWSEASRWAAAHGHRFARIREGSGFVIEPSRAAAGWRLEWGPPQRHYLSGPELRLRAEVAAVGDLQMLVMTRSLMEQLEQQVYEEFTEGTQTRMDDSTPEEMRWLVLYPKVPRSVLGALSERFGVVSNLPRAAPMWLEGPLAQQLQACGGWLAAEQRLVLVVQRGRLTLRCGPAQPSGAALRGAERLFEVARAAAQRVGEEIAKGQIGSERPSGWGPPSAMPDGRDPLP